MVGWGDGWLGKKMKTDMWGKKIKRKGEQEKPSRQIKNA